MTRLTLSDDQQRQLSDAERLVPPDWREGFRATVSIRLGGHLQPSDLVVQRCIDAALTSLGTTLTTSVTLCDAAPNKGATTMTNKQRRYDDDDDAFDERGILKDGRSLRVPMMLRDGAMERGLHRAETMYAMDTAAARFGLNDGLQLRKPGYRHLTDSTSLTKSRPNRCLGAISVR